MNVKLLVLIFIIFSKLLLAYDIDEMLDLYRKNNDLSEKTKNESLGHLTVYTRDDLERMQAHTLSDVLNSIRSFRYDENRLGMTDVLHSEPSLYASDVVKIFINNYEITSAYAGSGLYVYGNIDLGFVDHVEIYEGSSSAYVNTGLSVVTIKLYSKDPSREIGGHLQLSGGSRASHYENISYAGEGDDLQYYLYASAKKTNREEYSHSNHQISRDYTDKHALLTLSYKNIALDAEILDHKMDPFLSLSMFATPKSGEINYLLNRLSSTMTFLENDSLKLYLSFMRIEGHMDLSMDGSRWSNNTLSLFQAQDKLVSDSIDDNYKIKLEKDTLYDNHRFITGIEYSKRDLHDVDTYNNGIAVTTPNFVDNTVLSAYIQDDYSLGKNQIITASVKFNHYDSASDKAARVFDTTQMRLGYIVTSHTDVFKVFASQMELPTERYMLNFSPQQYIELIRIIDFSTEYMKTIQNHKVGFCYEYIQNENPSLSGVNNLPDYHDNHSYSLKYEYEFDPFNSFKSMFYINEYHNSVNGDAQKVRGGFARLLNTWKKFDFYNEANYYHLDDSPIDGVGVNTGVRYKVTNSLIFTLKGTNIFDSAAKSKYDYVKLVGFTPHLESLYLSPIDRSFSIGMEYDF